jgi:hypothetical protein
MIRAEENLDNDNMNTLNIFEMFSIYLLIYYAEQDSMRILKKNKPCNTYIIIA